MPLLPLLLLVSGLLVVDSPLLWALALLYAAWPRRVSADPA